MQAVIYARISADRYGAGIGVGSQEADCRELAARLGHDVIDVHTDNDLTAYRGKPRPGYAALLDGLRSGRGDVVIAWHEDRLHRWQRELEDYIDVCEQRAIPTLFVKAGDLDLTTASGRMTARIRGAVAQGELEHMIERTRGRKQKDAEAGRWKGGRRPFGYANQGYDIVPAEAALIREATEVLLAGGKLGQISREWNQAGIRTTMGNAWRPESVRATLLKPRNAGLMVHRGEVIGKGKWDPIVDPEQWRALVDLLTAPGRRTNPSTARRWLGTGLYRCECGRPINCSSSNGRAAYRCRFGCRKVSKLQESVDAYVSEWLMAWLRDPDNARSLAREKSDPVAELEGEAASKRRRLNSLAAMCAAGQIDDEQLAEATRVIRADLDDLRVRIRDAYEGTALDGIADADDPGAAWQNADLAKRRAVLSAVAEVTLLAGGHGRPPGWAPGEPYFFPETVRVTARV